MNRIVDKVRRKIGQNKRNLDSSLNLEEFSHTQALGTDVRVSSSRNSVAESLPGTAYFKKSTTVTKHHGDGIESSRAKGKLERVMHSKGEFLEEENGVVA